MTEDNLAKAVPPTDQTLETVDGLWLRDALITGINSVVADRHHLNRINVFPVADGDTGTNLALTLHAVLVALPGDAPPHAGTFLEQVADHALDGARGNSGAILAQYWQGFFEFAADCEVLSPRQFADAAVAGARSARIAIAEPREGTMLTVIRDYAAALDAAAASGATDLREMLQSGLTAARESLARTPQLLKVLADSGVVDAGAQGFVDFLAGMQEYCDTGSVTNVMPLGLQIAEEDAIAPSGRPDASDQRYCTECMVTGDNLARRRLRDRLLETGGSSLVLAGTRGKLRVHIHSNHPDEVFAVCARFGDVSSQKADDMTRQADSVAKGGRIAIVADSGADLPDEVLESLGIHLVPLRVNVKDAQYIDKVSLSARQFYRFLDESDDYPTTSQPPPSDYRRQFEFLLSHVDKVLCVSLSRAVSGTWQAARSAARRVDEKRITVWDSRSVSSGQGLLTMFAAEAAEAGYAADEIIGMLDYMRTRTHTFAAISELSYAVRGGRIRPWVGKAARLLHLTPILTAHHDGTVKPAGMLLGRGNTVRKFARWLQRRLVGDRAYRVLIADCDAPDQAEQIRSHLAAGDVDIRAFHMTNAGAALGAHAGPGNVVVGFQEFHTPDELHAALNRRSAGRES